MEMTPDFGQAMDVTFKTLHRSLDPSLLATWIELALSSF
jgi:hypothetical protein